jgi:hypothetical protein
MPLPSSVSREFYNNLLLEQILNSFRFFNYFKSRGRAVDLATVYGLNESVVRYLFPALVRISHNFVQKKQQLQSGK